MDLDEEECSKPRVHYVVSQECAKVCSLLPSNRGRSALVHSLVGALGLFKRRDDKPPALHPVKPVSASPRDLLAYHDKDYVEYLFKPVKADGKGNVDFGLEDDCPPFPGLPQYVAYTAGASLTAARALREGNADVTIAWDGGRHHAQKAKAAGFCYVADVILSILLLRRGFPRPRILYLDLDLHFPDAVAHAFESPSSTHPPSVITLSIHHSAPGFYSAEPLSELTSPDATDISTLSIPLKQGASNETYAYVWKHVVEHVRAAFDPEYLVLQCGADGLAGDPCGIFNWAIDANSEGSMGWCVKQALAWNCRTMLLGGGGYNSPNTARAWAYLTSIACGDSITVDSDIPDHSFLSHYQPSFTFDVPMGNMQDQNTQEYLAQIADTFQKILPRLSTR